MALTQEHYDSANKDAKTRQKHLINMSQLNN